MASSTFGEHVPTPPTFSICIPAYNRADLLPALLDSVLAQDFTDFEVVIGEDRSPQRAQIRSVVESYERQHPGTIRYFENDSNVGYDGNLRELIEQSTGEYCVFMGNDDLMAQHALAYVAESLARHPGVGVVLRSYAAFLGEPDNIVRTTRYFSEERVFPPGRASVVTFFRRCVVISGLVIHRQSARTYATAEFDGTTLYQQYLVGKILMIRPGLFLPQVLALYRDGGVPDFGASATERGRFTPGTITPQSSLTFMRGMLSIARKLEAEGEPVYEDIRRDIANYSYPIIVMHRDKGLGIFLRYARDLAKLGLAHSPWFFIYTLLLILLGPAKVDRIAQWAKRRTGHSPVLGSVYRGETTT